MPNEPVKLHATYLKVKWDGFLRGNMLIDYPYEYSSLLLARSLLIGFLTAIEQQNSRCVRVNKTVYIMN